MKCRYPQARLGLTLGTTILVLALLSTLAFTMASGLVAHLNLSNRAVNQERALDLADSAVASAIEAIQADPMFGRSADGTVLRVPLQDTQEGLATFDPGEAAKLGIPYCVNNLSWPDAADGGDGASVPPFTARLVGVGRYGGVEQRVEVMLRMPTLAAIASEGRVDSTGSLLVAAVDDLGQVQPLVTTPTGSSRPADLVSNLKAPDAVKLSKDTVISGDIQSSGGVVYPTDSSVTIRGEIRTQSNPFPVPDLHPTDYDPAADTLPYTNLTWQPENFPTFQGLVRVPGSLSVTGDVTLESAVLYVNGDLTVNGALKGRGGVVATGRITITNGSNLDSGNHLSILAGGDIQLAGADNKTSFLQGLVYTRGNLSVRQLTLVGAAVCAVAPGGATLENANMIYLPGNESLNLSDPLTLKFVARPTSEDKVAYSWLAQVLKPAPGTTVTYRERYGPTIDGEHPEITKDALFELVYMKGDSEKHVMVADEEQLLTALKDFFSECRGAIFANEQGQLYMSFSSGDNAKINDRGLWEDCTGSRGGGVETMGISPGLTQVMNESSSQVQSFQRLPFDVDPNKVQPWEDRLRIALWRRL